MYPMLNRKLVRELWRSRAQIAAIAFIIIGGVGTWVISFSTIDSLELMQSAYYREYRFADAFANVVRAPDAVSAKLREIPGVRAFATRVKTLASASVEGFGDPVTVEIVSIPDHAPPDINALYLRHGRLPEHLSSHEMVISEPFANAHALQPGDTLRVTINGRHREMTITGIGLSPEYVYQIQPGALFPDHTRFAIAWMRRAPLAMAMDMDGAFNDVAYRFDADSDPADVIQAIDDVLARYGGAGAYGREDHLSHQYLASELEQLRSSVAVVPFIFLGVAAFLVHLVTGRLIARQRDVIAILKAFGYGNRAIGTHYLAFTALIVLVGALPGVAVGAWLGRNLATLYGDFFNFPYLHYHLDAFVPASGVAIALIVALLGAMRSIRGAVRLPPAEAMRPELPAQYRATLIERAGLQSLFDQPTRMILRHVERQPVKAALSVLGIAMAGAILMVGNFQEDAIDHMLDVQFGLAQREDLAVTFTEPRSGAALHEVAALPGVTAVEPLRSVGVRLQAGHRRVRTAIIGLVNGGDLHRVLDDRYRPLVLPARGLTLSRYFAEVLHVEPGDLLEVETLEGRRLRHGVPVAAIVNDFVGATGYMEINALNRLMREGELVNGVFLSADENAHAALYAQLKDRPAVAGISLRAAAIESFNETMGDTILIFAFVNTLLAGSIAFGIIYNSARIAFSERARELATLRVIGFTRGEITYILVGELALLTLAAIPPALLIGWCCASSSPTT